MKSLIQVIPVFFLILSGLLLTQPREGEEIDKIIAVVGNDIIMLSELNAQIMMFAQQDPSLSPNDPVARQRVLDMLINEKLVTMKAIEDSVMVTDEEIEAQWEQQLNEYVRHYGSVKRIEDIYGMSIDRMKHEFRDEIKKHLLSQKIKMMKFGDITVTQREVEDFYESYKDSLPDVPDQVELYHIVKNIHPKESTKETLYNLAMSVRDSIIKGGDFADFALRYSGDPGTQSEGGDLGWIQKGKLFPEFERAAIDLSEGQISNPTETPYGFHLIETLGLNKDSIHARHILFKFGQSDEDKNVVIDTLNYIKGLIESGQNFEELAKMYSDEADSRGLGGFIGKFPLDNIPPSLAEVINKLETGGVSEPLPYGSDPKPSYHILYKKSIIPAHKASVKEDYKELEGMAKSYKQSKVYQEWVQELRENMYWEIKE